MSIEQSITDKLMGAFAPIHFSIDNESHGHASGTAESHFKVVIVSDAFEGKRLVARHQSIYGLVADELAGELHALALHTYTRSEWEAKGEAPQSPNCLGGGH